MCYFLVIHKRDKYYILMCAKVDSRHCGEYQDIRISAMVFQSPRELPVNYIHSQYLLLCWAAVELTLHPGHSYQ